MPGIQFLLLFLPMSSQSLLILMSLIWLILLQVIEDVEPPADLVPEPDPLLIAVDKPSDLVKVSDKSPAAAKVSDESPAEKPPAAECVKVSEKSSAVDPVPV